MISLIGTPHNLNYYDECDIHNRLFHYQIEMTVFSVKDYVNTV